MNRFSTMRIGEKAKKSIAKHGMLSRGDSVLVGVSGGPDSMTLLHILTEIRSEYGLAIRIAHLNHGFREEADREAEFVRKTAESLGVAAVIRSTDVPAIKEREGLSAQEAAREARYAFFEEACRETGSNKVALAHTADDQAETVLMRLIRGSGSLGLSGIPPMRGLFIRPLIDCSRKEIEAYLSEKGIPFITDSSNLKTDYLRNRVRMELLPFLEGYNPNIKDTLIRTAELAYKDGLFLEMEAEKAYEEARDKGERLRDTITLDFKALKRLHPALSSRVVRKAIRDMKGDLKRVSFRHISDILNLLDNGGGIWTLHLPDVTVLREHDRVIFKKGKGRR